MFEPYLREGGVLINAAFFMKIILLIIDIVIILIIFAITKIYNMGKSTMMLISISDEANRAIENFRSEWKKVHRTSFTKASVAEKLIEEGIESLIKQTKNLQKKN